MIVRLFLLAETVVRDDHPNPIAEAKHQLDVFREAIQPATEWGIVLSQLSGTMPQVCATTDEPVCFAPTPSADERRGLYREEVDRLVRIVAEDIEGGEYKNDVAARTAMAKVCQESAYVKDDALAIEVLKFSPEALAGFYELEPEDKIFPFTALAYAALRSECTRQLRSTSEYKKFTSTDNRLRRALQRALNDVGVSASPVLDQKIEELVKAVEGRARGAT